MLASSIPSKFNIPFANSAGPSYIRTIPQASQIGITPGAASLTDGFPPLNFVDVAAGGVPPFGQDFNGLLNQITKIQQWQNAGGIFKYDSAFSTAIGGYPAGCVLMSTDNKTRWLNLADNNTTDPDGGSPANWTSDSIGKLARITIYINNAGTLQSSINGGAFANASSTFTPLTITKACDIEVQGGGGAGGGAAATGVGQVAAGPGGGAGGYARKWATTGFSGVTITVGADATGVSGAAGNNGNSSSFGALVSATGGSGGTLGVAATPSGFPSGHGNPGTGSGGDINITGNHGEYASYSSPAASGSGGTSQLGSGSQFVSPGPSAGSNATNYGSGGSGACLTASQAAAAGGNGKGGVIIVREYS